MGHPESENELTTTIHLGVRSVVADSPSTLIKDFLSQASPEENEAVKATLAGDGKSAMVFIHRGAQKGARFLLTNEAVTIGRSTESAIFLDDVTVSRKHATIELTENGFLFKDLGSLNGSYINNETIVTKALHTGDEIQVGKFHLLFITADNSANQSGEK